VRFLVFGILIDRYLHFGAIYVPLIVLWLCCGFPG
jgi:hypothetical protein